MDGGAHKVHFELIIGFLAIRKLSTPHSWSTERANEGIAKISVSQRKAVLVSVATAKKREKKENVQT